MAIADIVQRPGLLLAAALALHVGLISAQVTTQTGDTIFHAVVFGGVSEAQRGTSWLTGGAVCGVWSEEVMDQGSRRLARSATGNGGAGTRRRQAIERAC